MHGTSCINIWNETENIENDFRTKWKLHNWTIKTIDLFTGIFKPTSSRPYDYSLIFVLLNSWFLSFFKLLSKVSQVQTKLSRRSQAIHWIITGSSFANFMEPSCMLQKRTVIIYGFFVKDLCAQLSLSGWKTFRAAPNFTSKHNAKIAAGLQISMTEYHTVMCSICSKEKISTLWDV